MQTPYYVIHKEKLDILMNSLNEALEKYWPNSIVGYSLKTNALPWVVQYMQTAGYYAEAVSKDEYRLAQALEFGNHIIYNGPIKSKETFLEAVAAGCIVNVDSKREIQWLIDAGANASIGVRVNFDLEKYCPDESQCGSEGGRFGFCYENGELTEAFSKLSRANIRIAGLHLHCSSKTRSVNIYQAIAKICCEIQKKWAFALDYIDIGGGFFGGVLGKPDFEQYIRDVSDILKEYFEEQETKLIVEPGISLIGAPVDYVTSVVDVKDTTYNRFVITDGSRTNIDPLMRKTGYSYYVDYQNRTVDRKIQEKQVICGYTCMENDRFFIMNNAFELQENDQIIYEKVGAYTMCLTPLFIEFFPDVFLEDGGKLTSIRKRWDVSKVL